MFAAAICWCQTKLKIPENTAEGLALVTPGWPRVGARWLWGGPHRPFPAQCTGQVNADDEHSSNRMLFAIARNQEGHGKGREIRKEHLGVQNESAGWCFLELVGGFYEFYSWASSEHRSTCAGQSTLTTQTSGLRHSGEFQQWRVCFENAKSKFHRTQSLWWWNFWRSARIKYREPSSLNTFQFPKKCSLLCLFMDLSVTTLLDEYRKQIEDTGRNIELFCWCSRS